MQINRPQPKRNPKRQVSQLVNVRGQLSPLEKCTTRIKGGEGSVEVLFTHRSPQYFPIDEDRD